MNDPSQQNDPKRTGEKELDYSSDEAALKQLAESWNEETAERGDDIPS